ncbi:unnamed protein product [Rhodiola kirilowii]
MDSKEAVIQAWFMYGMTSMRTNGYLINHKDAKELVFLNLLADK